MAKFLPLGVLHLVLLAVHGLPVIYTSPDLIQSSKITAQDRCECSLIDRGLILTVFYDILQALHWSVLRGDSLQLRSRFPTKI